MTTTSLAPRAPVMNMGSLSDPAELGRLLAESRYFADAHDAAQAVVKVLAGAELGFGPIASMTGVYIVKGRVTLSANLMAAAIKRHPKYDYRIAEHTDEKASVKFFENGEHVGTSEFTMANARTAGLAGGENWKKYPSNMLLWRAMSNGAKFFCPDAFSGAPVYTPDELGADIDPETGDFVQGVVLEVPAPARQESTSPPPPVPQAEATPPASATDDRPAGEPESAKPVAPASPDNGQDEDPHVALPKLLAALKPPDSFLRSALMSYGVDDVADLTDTQAREVMGRAVARFPRAEGAA